jgi:predicted ribosomally synthesized peptide with nif11-like leader
MSVESAVAYIRRMREDQDFRKHLNEISEDEVACQAYVQAEGFEFTIPEFKSAQNVIYDEYGIDPKQGF